MNAGFDFAETAFGVFMSMSDEEYKRAVKDGVRFECANSFLPGEYALAKTELPVIREYVSARRAAGIGVDTVVFGSGRARSLPDGIGYSERSALLCKYYEFIRICGDIAASYGIKFALEPLNPAETNFMFTTIEGHAIASHVRHPAVKLLADIYHMSKQNEPLTNIPLVAISSPMFMSPNSTGVSPELTTAPKKESFFRCRRRAQPRRILRKGELRSCI